MSLNDLNKLHQIYPTAAGFAYLGERSIFGNFDLHNDLKNLSWFELNLYGITGKRFSAVELKILNFIWVSTSYADLRIWPNRIVALASSARSTPILALVGGISSCDADLFVAQPLVKCLSMYRNISIRINNGEILQDIMRERLNQRKTIYGFGRPLTSIDERVPHFVKFLHEIDQDKGKHYRMAFQIEVYLKEKKNLQMNIAALYAAVCADLGFNEVQMNLFVCLLVFAGMPPCYLDALNKPAGTVLPIPCEEIKYTGANNLKW